MKRVGTFLRLFAVALTKYDILLKKKKRKKRKTCRGNTLAAFRETKRSERSKLQELGRGVLTRVEENKKIKHKNKIE